MMESVPGMSTTNCSSLRTTTLVSGVFKLLLVLLFHLEVVIRDEHIHTHLTHSYILKKDPPPQCEHCQCILTVRHILVDCNHLAQTRNDIFGRCCVVESFKFHPELIFKIFKRI